MDRITHIFGYPVRLNVCVEGRWVDATGALTFDGSSPQIVFDEKKFLDTVDSSLARRVAWDQVGLPE